MKKYIYFLILTTISFIPILKVNALINNTSTSNILYAQYDSSYQEILNWVYNTSDDYLFSKLEDYEYKNINYQIVSYQNYDVLYLRLYGNNNSSGLINAYRSNSINRFQLINSTDISYYYRVYINNGIYYTDYTLQNSINEITDVNMYDYALDSARVYMWYENINGTNYETHNVSTNFIPYQVYFSNVKFVNTNISSTSNRKLILYDENDDLIGEYQTGDDVPSWRQQYHNLPSYLNNFEKVGLTPSNNTIIISNVSKGSIYIPVEDFNRCNGLFGYFDKELTSQPYSSVITDYTRTLDGLYIRQDFDISSYVGADYMYYQKCQIVNPNDNIYKFIWLPDENYTSPITSEENQNGGLDYSYRVEEGGEIVENTFSSLDNILDNNNPLLNTFFNDFSTNYFGISSIITAPLSLINQLSSSTCSPLILPFPYSNENIILPCMSTIYEEYFGTIFNLYQFLLIGFVSYRIARSIFYDIKNLKDPNNDEVEVVDL